MNYIEYGKENSEIQKSAKLISEMLPKNSLEVLPDMYHGEFSINHAMDYADTVRTIIGER